QLVDIQHYNPYRKYQCLLISHFKQTLELTQELLNQIICIQLSTLQSSHQSIKIISLSFPCQYTNSSSLSSHPSQTIDDSELLQGSALASQQQQPVLSAVPSEQRYPVPNLVPAGSFHLSEGGTQFAIDDSDLVQAMEESTAETGVTNPPVHHAFFQVGRNQLPHECELIDTAGHVQRPQEIYRFRNNC
ncbi:uncharacterized protein, partial [Amphiura filiformis]|uniref:uncharacterized protein n=1 Tax=Amphiura filiformis TaxID=82378 RepID=UPI003B217E3E